ncbi:MAG: hypothetical protein QXJ97_03975 [Desulfurococcaceae archaeon]
MRYLDYELVHAAYKLVKDVLKLSTGDEVVITIDTAGDWNVAEATAEAATIVGAKPVIVLHQTPIGVGMATDKYLPVKTLTAILREADVWIEYNRNWLLYSTPYWKAIETGKVKYMCLVGMYSDMMVRTIGRVDLNTIYTFQRKLASITKKCKKMRITSPAGMNVEIENDPARPVLVEGEVDGPGEYMLFGQVDWAPIEDSINGVLVFDGSIWPPEELGILKTPIKLHVVEGKIKKIEGGYEAKLFEKWIKSFNDEKMLNIAHISYGCNPGAKLSGNILEDERVWGVVEWGIGSQSPTFKGKLGPASSHTDGVCLNPTVECDGELIIVNGEYVHGDLIELAMLLRTGTR